MLLEKEIAKKIINDAKLIQLDAKGLKDGLLGAIGSLILSMRETIGGIPNEKVFKDAVVIIVNDTFVDKYLPFFGRRVMKFGLTKMLIYAIDRLLIDKIFGDGWFLKARQKALNLLNKTEEHV